ncbi:hypothetical protein Bca4012_014972 [Brassica carinata]
MDSSDGKIKWEEIFSLGDEAIILDLGITVLSKDTDIFVFNLDTNKVEQLSQLDKKTKILFSLRFHLVASNVVSTMEVTRSGSKINLHCWSELPLDLMRLVFDRLGFADFERARNVCPSWHSASRQSKPNNKIPWLFLIPKDKNYGLLFNPEEKDKFYKTQDLGNDFGKSSCVATYKSWLLMITYTEEVYLYNPYILDLLTRERINLPTFETNYGLISPVLWIDEKTKDYLVIGMLDEENMVSIKKGDISWKTITQLSLSSIEGCFNMIYKDHKLHCLHYHKLTIFDFSGHVPLQVLKISVRGCVRRAAGLAISWDHSMQTVLGLL